MPMTDLVSQGIPAAAGAMIDFRCPQCQRLLRIAAASGGSQARCPGCGALMTVPQGSARSPSPPPLQIDGLPPAAPPQLAAAAAPAAPGAGAVPNAWQA